MKITTNYPLRLLALAASLWLLSGVLTTTSAQNPGSTGPTPTPAPVPLDGGASLLLAGGVAFGLRKLRNRRRLR